ncbi:MAG TPA: tetratricopeptide repeat protein, partial [Nitrososphaera sp.]|nr:tetratricopeptide repeat protein [Nitrososphaera sp.]
MRMRSYIALLAMILLLGILAEARTRQTNITAEMPLTTKSPEARSLYKQAMTDFANLHVDKAMQEWRKATKLDPNFAMAHIQLALNSHEPSEQQAEIQKATKVVRKVSPGERLFIRWIEGVREKNFVYGIQAMNDVAAMFPKDKDVLYTAGNWLVVRESYEQSKKFMDKVLALDPSYPPALNDLGYDYAYMRDYKNAIATMERYVAALPGEPNPNDSYAEILRMSGDFNGALEHYRAALKIDPTFTYSQLGIADTYALMGKEEQARAEYSKAVAAVHSDSDRIEFSIQAAMTWVRESKYSAADAAFISIASEAHAKGLYLHEAQAYRMMAQYQPENALAIKELVHAENVLSNNSSIPKADRDEEQARIWRWRAVRSANGGDRDSAEKCLTQLASLSETSGSQVVERLYHAAMGGVLLAEGKASDAIAHLEEDQGDAFTLKMLAEAYVKTGALDQAQDTLKT